MYTRHLLPLVRDMLGEFRIVYVPGPRQSGKTTLVRGIAAESGMRYLTFDDPAVRAAAAGDPHGFVRSLGDEAVVLDEFQDVPGLVPAIKEASDLRGGVSPDGPVPGGPRKGLFLLTGSADLFRSARAQEALPGHMARLELLPLSLAEIHGTRRNLVDYLLAGDFSGQSRSSPAVPPTRGQIANRILLGGYPEVQGMSPRARRIWFRSYTEGRFFRDFETLYTARGDHHSRIRALAPFLAGLSGNLLRYASLANALELNDKLAKSYVEVLELMFLIRRVPSYRKNLARRMAVRMPKLHFLDTGLACHLLGLRNEDRLLTSPHYGALLETLVYTELAKHAEWAEEEVGLYHFRDKRKREADIVAERPDGRIVGVEVKASATVRREDFNGLAALAEFAGAGFERGVLFYTGAHVLPFHRGDVRFHALPLHAGRCASSREKRFS
ncbi:MAG: ATP-binding protein [Gemmatimonadetes bacterium]|nr:ATP-binding protein [Gemmatimonadota bacterium]MYD14324.1 ATP-binding protein [Gemmatimonadota bacterium]MYI66896.1 ATP-binding protein [Gemmatimonadota bacterium]